MPAKPKVPPVDDAPDDPPAPVVEVDDEPGEDTDEVQLTRSGAVRLRFDGRVIRLRRPLFGELRTLRLALEDAGEAISDAAEDGAIIGARLVAEATGSEESDADPVDKVKRRREIQRESRAAARDLVDLGENERLRWWLLVIDTLASVDSDPVAEADFPSWIIDHTLPNTVIQHWRSVPLGRGSR